ncbi:MAG: tetratricopeptide repeat protein [Parcubacteria group bacterium]|nr:tetratricopeptide repeat protein [Parcubacteria group bacterium]
MSNKTLFWGGLTLIVVVGIGYYNIRPNLATIDDESEVIVTDDTGGRQENIEKTSDVVVETDNTNGGKVPITERVSAATTIPVPDLDRPVIFPGGYSVEKAKEITEQIAILTDALKADNNRFNEWLDLGMLRKSIEDYDGAREAWEYASVIRPGNSLSFANLGTLYGYYLKNPIKAEANLLHAIENEPRFLDFYARMTDFYVEVMNDKSKAIDFLDRAIAKYPEWTELKTLKEHVTRQ